MTQDQTTSAHPYRLSALAIILGAILGPPAGYLFLLTHGPYGDSLNQVYGDWITTTTVAGRRWGSC